MTPSGTGENLTRQVLGASYPSSSSSVPSVPSAVSTAFFRLRLVWEVASVRGRVGLLSTRFSRVGGLFGVKAVACHGDREVVVMASVRGGRCRGMGTVSFCDGL